MSRSRKKIPIIGLACCKPETQSFYRKLKNRCIRRRLNHDLELDGRSHVKNVKNDYSMDPYDGKVYWDEPKGYRK